MPEKQQAEYKVQWAIYDQARKQMEALANWAGAVAGAFRDWQHMQLSDVNGEGNIDGDMRLHAATLDLRKWKRPEEIAETVLAYHKAVTTLRNQWGSFLDQRDRQILLSFAPPEG